MAPFNVNTHRIDPYKSFKFRVKWDGRYVAGVSAISGLVRTTEVIEHRDGGDSNTTRRSPGRTAFAPITLERGVTHDTAFEQWATLTHRVGAGLGQEVALRDLRKDIGIELMNEAGQIVLAYRVYRCWVSRYEALAGLEAGAGRVAVERLTLENEGWERDVEVSEPAEPGA